MLLSRELPSGHEAVTDTPRNGGLVVFALVHELCAARVIAEDFVVEIEPRDNSTPAAKDSVARLCVDLEMRESVDVA